MLNAIVHKDAKGLEVLMREQYDDARQQILLYLINNPDKHFGNS
jgi:hypothetical protein